MDLEKLMQTKEFLDEVAVSVRNVIFAMISGTTPEDREDIDQLVKLKLWKKISRGKKVDDLRSYLGRVAYTTALDVVKKRGRRVAWEEAIQRHDAMIAERLEVSSPEILITEKENSEIVGRYIDKLKPRRKAVLRLHLRGMDLAEIARELNISENQARHLLYRGKEDLAVILKRTLRAGEPS